ncbi:MAG: DUF951 domain-containing protein [Chloroflexi bacterium]|nr:MAG: DUF951 domain-containing protein [Chloroflexota bacterium]HDN80871.1 DUF951 domain-containing protein [Chloroflexota bacterium]
MPLDIHIDDVVRLRKPHPCGANQWLVFRVGADVGIKCMKCGRRVLLPRSVFEKRFKAFIKRARPSLEDILAELSSSEGANK